MKTSYLQRRNKEKGLKRLLVLLVALTVIAAFSLLGVPFVSFFSPIWKSENFLSQKVSQFVSQLRSKNSLIEENANLKQRMESLYVLETMLRASEEREARLIETVGRLKEQGGVLAAVLVHPPRSPYDTLIVDAGEEEGVMVGQRVYAEEGPSIGVVSEVNSNTSKVTLYTSGGENTNAVLERGNMPIILSGDGGGNFKITLPRDISVEVGDRVLSPNLNSTLIAVVGDVSISPTESFKEVLAVSPINIFGLRYVVVRP